jgi:hypothetical protein
VIHIASRADMTSEELSRAHSIAAALPPRDEPTEGLQPSGSGPPIFLFADADRLSDERIREICSLTEHDLLKDTAVLLLARSGFLARLEEQPMQFLRERLVVRFKFQNVEYLRHQPVP